jgi:hypothetical protein
VAWRQYAEAAGRLLGKPINWLDWCIGCQIYVVGRVLHSLARPGARLTPLTPVRVALRVPKQHGLVCDLGHDVVASRGLGSAATLAARLAAFPPGSAALRASKRREAITARPSCLGFDIGGPGVVETVL